MPVPRISVASLLVFLAVGCIHGGGTIDPAVARTDDFVLTRSLLNQWAPVLERDRIFRRKLAQAKNREEVIAREAALTAILETDHADELPEITRRQLWRDLQDAAVNRSYVNRVLAPRIIIEPEELRAVYTEHRENYRRPPGVTALEIFLWAPEKLPELRAEKRRLLQETRKEITDPGSFRRKAELLSDATSAYRGGAIGTITKNRTGGALREALFSGRLGMTDIVESPEGLFLFWITRMIPPKDNAFEDVADAIEKRLRSLRLAELKTEDLNKLLHENEIELRNPEDETQAENPVLILNGRSFSLEALALPVFDARSVKRRAVTMIRKEMLEAGGFEIDQPDRIVYRYRLSRRILSRLVDREAATQTRSSNEPAGQPSKGPALERWTFDLLRIPDVHSPGKLSMVFRALHDLGPGAGITELANLLERQSRLKGNVTRYDDVSVWGDRYRRSLVLGLTFVPLRPINLSICPCQFGSNRQPSKQEALSSRTSWQ